MPTSFQERYRAVVDSLYGPLPSGAGLSEEQVDAAERALGFQLPAALRDFHLLLGGFAPVTRAHNRFYAPADLRREGELEGDVDRATELALAVFREIYQLPADCELTVVRGWN